MKRNLIIFAIFQVIWTASVVGAGDGLPWLGPLAVLVLLPWTLWGVEDRGREVRIWICVGLLGTLIDSGLFALGWIGFPHLNETWPAPLVPLWISGLWVSFGVLLRSCLVWLHGRLVWAAGFGLIGGPFSFYTGTRFDAVSVPEPQWLGFVALSVEWALLTPLLLWWTRRQMPSSDDELPLAEACHEPAA